MSELMEPVRRNKCARGLPLVFVMLSMAGCASMSHEADLYYRLQAQNFKEAQERAKKQEASLERQSSVLAASGDVRKAQKAHKEIERIKAWEAKMAKQEKRFEKAAEWTEEHFHLEKPALPGEPTRLRPENDGVSSPPSELTNP